MTIEIIEEWMTDPSRYVWYDAGFSSETWGKIYSAIATHDDLEACRIYRHALREEMHSDAEKEAENRVAESNN